jgi:holliday junction DNA helicase RuvB
MGIVYDLYDMSLKIERSTNKGSTHAKSIAFLLNLMETGIVSGTKYNRTRMMKINTSVFATSNNVEKIIEPLQSSFFVAKLQAYTYEQFYRILLGLLTSNENDVDEDIANATKDAVWRTSGNIRDAIKIAKMAKSLENVNWLMATFSIN